MYNKVGVSMKKVEIEKMDHQGRGIGYIEKKVTFVKNALPKEIVNVSILKETKKYNIGKVVEYLNISEKRVAPFCPYFTICGGCDLEHMSYSDTLKYKGEKVENILTKEKIPFPKIEVIQNPSPKNYRNKLSLKIVKEKIGFYEENSHTLIEISECPIASASINKCLQNLKSLQIQNGNVTIRSNLNEEILLILETEEEVHFKIENFKENKIVGVLLNDKTIYGQPFFYERMNGFLFKVSYDAFFQVNHSVASHMFSLINENIESGSIVLDLYAGVGTLGLVASKKASKVYSIEIVKNAVLDNVENKKLNKCENVFPMFGDVEKVLFKINENFATILIDPPRKGLSKETRNIILKSNARKIIYISCNPLTLARDLKELTEKYEIKKFFILDMFSYTHHVESFCILERR